MKKTHQMYAMMAVTIVIVAGLSFLGGMQFQKRRSPIGMMGGQFNRQFGENGRGKGQGGNIQFRQGGNSGGMRAGRPVNGEVISQDEKSITVKMPDGGSKIVILSEKTQFNKTSEGAKTDLKVGDQVTAFGTTNADGSITAQMVGIGGGVFRNMMREGQVQASESPTPTKN